MAQPRVARLVKAEHLGAQARLLRFALAEGEIGFAGGQYIIVNTGIELASASSPSARIRFSPAMTISASFRLQYGESAKVRAELHASDRSRRGTDVQRAVGQVRYQRRIAGGHRLVLATDTGITAALGLLQGLGSRPLADDTTAVWFVESEDYFLSSSFVRHSLAGLCQNLAVVAAPEIADTARIGRAAQNAGTFARINSAVTAFPRGDGAVIYPLREKLVAAGTQKENIHLEAFFNNPERKAQS